MFYVFIIIFTFCYIFLDYVPDVVFPYALVLATPIFIAWRVTDGIIFTVFGTLSIIDGYANQVGSHPFRWIIINAFLMVVVVVICAQLYFGILPWVCVLYETWYYHILYCWRPMVIRFIPNLAIRLAEYYNLPVVDVVLETHNRNGQGQVVPHYHQVPAWVALREYLWKFRGTDRVVSKAQQKVIWFEAHKFCEERGLTVAQKNICVLKAISALFDREPQHQDFLHLITAWGVGDEKPLL
jgi:hypothetical protein